MVLSALAIVFSTCYTTKEYAKSRSKKIRQSAPQPRPKIEPVRSRY